MRPEFFFSNYFRDVKPDEIQNYRNKALKEVTKYEWPKFKKSEFWKYTNPDGLFDGIDKTGHRSGATMVTDVALQHRPEKDEKGVALQHRPIESIDIDKYLIEDAINILDTEDGFLIRDAMPQGVSIVNINEYMPSAFESLRHRDKGNSYPLPRKFKKEIRNLLLLNKSYLNSGFYLKIEDNKNIDIPIQIIYTKGNEHVFRKNIIEIGKFSKATIIETYISENDNNLFFNIDNEITVGESASLSHYKMEFSDSSDRIFNNVNININKDAYYNNFYFTNGGNKIKNNIVSNLQEEGSYTELNSLYLLKNKNHVDDTTVINHIKPNTKSRQFYKGLLKDESIAIFDGLVEIFKNAKLSDSNQLNQTMLLSEKATINSKPQLVIGNDDVKCSHGATSGQMDKNQIFYLQSRGMNEKEAAKLLSKAFVAELVNKIKEESIKEFLVDYVNENFWS